MSEISIHALREEGDHFLVVKEQVIGGISIHALREEGDDDDLIYCEAKDISIHALREEGDEPNRKGVSTMKIFLSTPSARRAT